MNDYLLVLIQKTKVDSSYSMKSHYNASNRLRRYSTKLGVLVIILSSIVGTSIFISVTKEQGTFWKILTGFIAVSVVILSALQTFLKFDEKSESHVKTANELRSVNKNIQALEHFYKGNMISDEDAAQQVKLFREKIDRIINQALLVNDEDYKKSKIGIIEGEINYTDKEIEGG